MESWECRKGGEDEDGEEKEEEEGWREEYKVDKKLERMRQRVTDLLHITDFDFYSLYHAPHIRSINISYQPSYNQ